MYTLLYHLKARQPFSTTAFREKYRNHVPDLTKMRWSIVEAKGIRPAQAPASLRDPGQIRNSLRPSRLSTASTVFNGQNERASFVFLCALCGTGLWAAKSGRSALQSLMAGSVASAGLG